MERDVSEREEIKEVKEKNRRVAAFFDLDGTLMPLPSLERRFLRMLCDRGEIPAENYLFWFHEALKLLPRGISRVMNANKMYLRGANGSAQIGAGNQIDFRPHESGHPSQLRDSEGEGRPSVPPKHNPRWPVPHFFEDGVQRIAWHAKQGQAIAIVSGTLEPLANAAARALEIELAAREIGAEIPVFATKLEENDGKWTGQILGEAMFGKAKERAILVLAEEMSLDLSQSWAYGDSAQDRWMLAAVGNPVAVNPSRSLARVAQKRGWSALRWCGERNLTRSSKRAQRHTDHREKTEGLREARTTESVLQFQELHQPLPNAERCA